MRKIIFIVIALCSIFLTEGPNDGATFSSDSGNGGTWEWANPSNTQTSNNVYASITTDEPATSEWLKATNFGFSSVTGTVTGIQVEIEERGVTGSVFESDIILVKGGTVTGDDKSTGANLPTTDTYVTYGSTSDLWGLSWSPSDITASNFGVVFSFFSSTPTNTRIDHIRITVTYTTSGGTNKRRIFGETRDANGNGRLELMNEYEYRVNWKFAK